MITDYFEQKSIEYWAEGKNISKGWVGIQCIYCNDHSNHLGVELATGRVSCWLCGGHGGVVNLIQDIEQCSYAEAKKIEDQIWESGPELFGLKMKLPPSSTAPSRVTLPPILNTWPQKYVDYLIRRKFDAAKLIKKYNLKAVHRFGQYGFRIMVPFFVDRKLVTFTAMDVTGKKEAKYKHCEKIHSVLPVPDCMYNIDNVRGQKAVIVEGVTDVWRIGDGAVGLSTNKISDSQLIQLMTKDIKEVLILLDSDALNAAKKVVDVISATCTIDNIDVGYLDRDDPDKMSYTDLLRVQKWLS